MTTALAASTEVVADAPARPGFWRRFRENRAATAALIVLLLLAAVSLAAPLIAPYSPQTVDVPRRLSLSTPEHWLGTDGLGRDTLSRLLYAGRVSLLAAALAVAIATIVGVPLGVLAGYVGGTVDWLLGRAGDVLMTFPAIVLAIAIIAATGPGLQNAMIALGIVYAPRLFRVARAATLQVRAETYVEASISIGTPALRVIRRRVLPNIASPVLVQVSVMLAAALLAEAALSLLGLGVVPPTPSWGVLLGTGFKEIRSTPLLVFWPGVMIAVATLAFNLLGDGVRDAMGRRARRAGS